jgi:hypothetical protein
MGRSTKAKDTSLNTTDCAQHLTTWYGLRGAKGKSIRLPLGALPPTGCAFFDRGHRLKLLHPKIAKRLAAAKQRCENPKSPGYTTYGARSIKFEFSSVLEAYVWVLENLGLPPEGMELDRIDNTRGYAPGNLRWSTKVQNRRHTSKTVNTPALHRFRLEHPEVRYADNTMKNLLSMGLTFHQIVERWGRPSCKPKGVYGTCSIADPFIASLHKES